jgi:hypothetical protein
METKQHLPFWVELFECSTWWFWQLAAGLFAIVIDIAERIDDDGHYN